MKSYFEQEVCHNTNVLLLKNNAFIYNIHENALH